MGVRYLLLVVLGTVGALALARYFALGTAATAATLLPAMAPLYLAWAAFRHQAAGAGPVDLDLAADQLAHAVRRQWAAEARLRRVNDPYPLPVSWRGADAELVEPWSLLTYLPRAWPGGPPGDPAAWPADPAGLAGSGAQIGEVFSDRVPTGRLVVLGEPGAGKTVLLIRLLEDLCERRTAGGLVPVLFSLASWDPAREELTDWLAEQLRRSHPALRAPAAGTGGGLARALLDERRILPLLDGFDELPPALHPRALAAVNGALSAKQPVVLACRTDGYRAALARSAGAVRLNGAAGIQLLPLTAAQAAAYLRRDAGGPHAPAAERWRRVVSHLGTDTPVGQALSTPLGLFLARTIHNPRTFPQDPAHTTALPQDPARTTHDPHALPQDPARTTHDPHALPQDPAHTTSPGARGEPVPHPDTLCDPVAFPTRAALDTHLFNAFIPAAYAPYGPRPPRWTAERARHVLVFLARHLAAHHGGGSDLAWWEFHRAMGVGTLRLSSGLVSALAFGLGGGLAVGLVLGTGPGLATGGSGGLVYGGTVALLQRPSTPGTRPRLRRSSGRLRSGLSVGLAFGLAGGLAGGLAAGVAGGVVCGLAVGFAGALVGGIGVEKPDLTTAIGPGTLLALDRRTFLVIGTAAALVVGLVYALGVLFAGGLLGGLVVGIGGGLAAGLATGPLPTAWADFLLAKAYLAVRHRLPWNLMAFLRDAHEQRGVLRQAGAVYQFRHIDLQRHLAAGAPGAVAGAPQSRPFP
ncbi:NACHT domain-containing protein [Streptomyces sp. NPDC017940]|uniref:NACHT domain-containing protein n=1 Tax=Streptomyces sp. NPDC017940 TaxID=3365017 RepID=UPI0037AC14DC